MAGPLREKIPEWVSRCIPHYSRPALLIIALNMGHDVVQNGILGYLVLLIQNQWTVGDLRTSGVIANVQKGIEAFLRVFLVYMAENRIGVIRMTLYSYAASIAGLQLLWDNQSKGLWYYCLALIPLTIGQAGGGCISYLLGLQLEEEAKKGKEEIKKPVETKGGTVEKKPAEAKREEEKKPELHYTLKHLRDVELYNAGSPGAIIHAEESMAPAGESCVSFFLGEQYNWRPHVCPMVGKEGAREGIGGCCYHAETTELNCHREPHISENVDQDDDEPDDVRKTWHITRFKVSIAKFPGTFIGAVFVSKLSFKQSFKISTALMGVVYHLFFWMSKGFYKYEKEVDKEDENQSQDPSVSVVSLPRKTIASEFKEAVEFLLKLFPLWLPFVFTCYLVDATGDTFFMSQVDYLESHTQQTKLPKGLFYSGPKFVTFVISKGCGYLIELFSDENKQRWARLFRISVGMVFSFFGCIVASLVARRLDGNSSVSMFWLVPQYLLLGMMQGIIDEGLSEFLYDHLHEGKEFHAVAVCGCAEGLGSLVSAILTLAAPSSWIGSDIGKSNLYYYYRMLAIISLCSTFLFVIVAIAYELWGEHRKSLPQSAKKMQKRGERRAEAFLALL